MNVRFFAGTRAQYDSLPAPRNPLGLYFCADTKELFWADRLLTDGTRIIATESELPKLNLAADGVTYFVEATRNGYVISPDRTKWIQVIQATASNNTGDSGNTENAVKAISFAGIELEEAEGVFTIDRRCAREALGFEVPEGFEDKEIEILTKEYLDERLAQIPGTDFDLTQYYTKEEIDALVPDTSNFVTKAELPSIEGLASEQFVINKIAEIATPEVPTKVSELENDANYATEQYVIDAIANQVPVSDLAKKEEVEEVKTKLEAEVLPTIKETILPTVQELAEKAATQEWVQEQGYLTEHQDLSEYAKKSELPSVEGLASEEFVIKKIAEAELADQDVDLSAYYTKSETDTAINAAIDAIEIPKAELYKVDFNAPDFVAALEAYNNGKLLLLVNAAPDADGYAVMNYVRADLITFTKFLTSRSEAYGSFNTYYLHSDNTWEISKEVRLNKVEANVEGEVNDELTSIRIGKEIYKLPTVDLTGYATKDELATIEAKIPTDYLKEIPSEYITETRLNEVLADIEHPSVDLSGYATTESVEALAADIEHDRAQLESIARATESTRAEVATLSATTVTQKYEVLPIEGMLIQYRDGEIRLNTQRVVPSLQQVGATGNPNMYYATFRAFAPEGATQCKEGLNGVMDADYSELSTDTYGRKYTTIWSAIANTVDGGTTWSKWGNTSTLDKYLGFYYHFEWYNGDVLIGKDKVRVILTNDACHDDLVPDAIARRIDEKIKAIDIPDVSKFITEIPEEYVTAEELAAEGFLTEHQSLEEYAKSKTVVAQKYEVLPIEGMFVQYNDNEVRVNTQHVDIASLPKQEAGDGSSDSYYYITFRAYAPEGATSVIEGSGDKMDAEHSTLATDNYGRKYTTIWAAIANKSGDTWSKFGDKSTIDKYLGFYYNFHWYTDDKLLSKEKVRVILTNDSCHNDLVPDAVARRIDDKVALVNTTINNITEQVQNIEENYVTNEVLENYATTEELEANYITTTEATTKIERIVEEIVQEVTTPGSLNYDTF